MRKFLTILFFFICTKSIALDHYFSNAGNDLTGTGSMANPYGTINKLNAIFSTFAAGDRVLFRGGDVFYGMILPTKSGVSGNPITLTSYGTGVATITGFQPAIGWTNIGTNLYESSAMTSATCNMVTINNSIAHIGRYPNSSYLTINSVSGSTSFTSSALNATKNWTGGYAVVRQNNYTISTAKINTFSGTTINYAGGKSYTSGYGFFINDSLAVDTVGEWYYSANKKVRVYSTSTPTNVQVAQLDYLINLTGISYITINNLNFTGCNVAAMYCQFNSPNCVITNNTISYSGGSGIYLPQTVSNEDVENNNISWCTQNGIFVGDVTSTGDIIKNNTVKNIANIEGQINNAGATNAITSYPPNSLVQYNKVDSCGGNGIFFRGAGTRIWNNFIKNSVSKLSDQAAIYTAFSDAGRSIIGNAIINVLGNGLGTTSPADSSVNGIYLDDSCSGVSVKNNTIANIGLTGIFCHSCHNNSIQDNTVYDAKGLGYNQGAFSIQKDQNTKQPIANDTLWGNILFARTATEKCFYYTSNDTPFVKFKNFGLADSNYYARPISNTTNLITLSFFVKPYTTSDYNVPQWQTFSGLDVHSFATPVTITNTNQIFFAYNPNTYDSTITLPTGTFKDVKNVSYTGTTVLHGYTSVILLNTGTQTTPTITWSNPANITYGVALSSTQLNATASTSGTFSYNYSVGTVLNAGTYTLTVTFTPTDQVNYTTATKSVTLTIIQASASLAASNTTQTYTGAPLQPTITTTPNGLTVINNTYNGVGTIPTNAGNYAVVSGLTNNNYTANPLNFSFTINKATVTITVSNTSQIYDGTAKSVTVTTNPNVTGISVTYNGSSTIPTTAGSYTVVASLTNANYQATPVTTTLVIAKATPTVSWATPSAITYGTALSGTQLNATASVAGTFSYTPASGSILNAGTQSLSVNFTPTDATDYNSVSGTTVSLVVNKATATISLSGLNQVYDGTGKSATVTTSPAGLTVITTTYAGSATLPINAGSYAVSSSLSNSNYNASPATGTLVIAKATATLSLSNTNYTYDGSGKNVTVTTSPAGLTTVTTTYNGSSVAPTTAGSYSVLSTLNNANYQGSISGTMVIGKATPVITWLNPSAITYGTALSSTQLNASTTIAGTFTYTPASGTILDAGNTTLSVNFTPSDATDYNSVNGTTVSITVNKATATISLSNLNQYYDGNPKPATVTTVPAGLTTITTLYNGSATVPSAVGTYPVNSSLTNSNYSATPATGNLVISNSSAGITITNLNQTYTGSPLPVTVTTNPSGYTYSVTYNGSATVPTNAGSYTAIATITQTGHSGADTETYIIAKATPSISWSNPSNITYGTPLSGTQLNASSTVSGTFSYNPASGTVLNVGTQTLSTTLTPSDASNYNSASATVTIVVSKATATINLTNLSKPYDGTQKTVTATTTPAGLSTLNITYNGSNTPPSAVGSYQVIGNLTNSNYQATPDTVTLTITSSTAGISISNLNQFYTASPLPVTVTTNPNGLSYTLTYAGSATVPTKSGTYQVIATLTGGTYTGADTETYVISKAQSGLTWANPAAITYGTSLSSTQLNATASTAGTFTYLPVSGTILNAGTQSLSVSFVPTDTNYLPASKSVSIVVNPASATLNLSNLNQTYDSTQKKVLVTTSPANLQGVTILYNGSPTQPINAGSYPVTVTLNNSDYSASPVSGTLVIAKASSILSWNPPLPIQEQTPLSSLQLNATSNRAGSFIYNYPVGSKLSAGTYILVATFTPTNTNYNVQTISVPLSVYGAPVINFFIKHGKIVPVNLPQ